MLFFFRKKVRPHDGKGDHCRDWAPPELWHRFRKYRDQHGNNHWFNGIEPGGGKLTNILQGSRVTGKYLAWFFFILIYIYIWDLVWKLFFFVGFRWWQGRTFFIVVSTVLNSFFMKKKLLEWTIHSNDSLSPSIVMYTGDPPNISIINVFCQNILKNVFNMFSKCFY